ncbi:MAG: Rieske 2Fe-2S domain-containing protein [Candidatus Kapaibacterium sp.]
MNTYNYPEIEKDGVTYLLVSKSIDVFEGRSKNIIFDEELQIAIFRVNGLLYAVSNICLHQHAAVLCDGYVEKLTVRCPLHGWVYSLETGQTHGSRSHLKTYKIWEHQGDIYVEQPTAELPKWMDSL